MRTQELFDYLASGMTQSDKDSRPLCLPGEFDVPKLIGLAPSKRIPLFMAYWNAGSINFSLFKTEPDDGWFRQLESNLTEVCVAEDGNERYDCALSVCGHSDRIILSPAIAKC